MGSRKRRHHSKPGPRLDPTRPDMKLGQHCCIVRDANGQALAYALALVGTIIALPRAMLSCIISGRTGIENPPWSGPTAIFRPKS
jgi:hypothetical protein